MQSASGMNGYANTHLLALLPMTFTSRCLHCLKGTLRNKSSGIRRSQRRWSHQSLKAITPLTIAELHCGEWHQARTDRIGKRAEVGLSGRWFLDYPEVDSRRSCESCLVVCAVRDIKDRGYSEVTCRFDVYS